MTSQSKKKTIPTGDGAALQLLARGDCYNPQCTEPLITLRAGRPVVNFQFAHIRDELPPSDPDADIGWRYWPAEDLDQSKRNRFDNLLLLCTPCHKLIDKIDPRAYTVERLREWKSKNESDRAAQIATAFGMVADADVFEAQLVKAYVAELYVALERQKDELTAILTGGDSFPLAKFAICDPKHFKYVSPQFTAVGERPVTDVGVVVEIHTPAGMRLGFNEDQYIPALHAGRSVRIWDGPGTVRSIPVDWDTLNRIAIKFWAANGRFEQVTLFNPLLESGRTPTMGYSYNMM